MAAENSSGKASSEKDSGLLTSVAESIGSTLGTLVARAGAAQKSLSTAASDTVATVRKATTKVRATRKPTRRGATKKTSAKRAPKPARRAKSKNTRKSAKAAASRKRRSRR